MKGNTKVLDLDSLLEQGRSKLAEYIRIHRPEWKPGEIHFSCPHPNHPDRHPSCGIVPGTNLFHCFGCGQVGDVYTAAHYLEGKPLEGKGFLVDNVFHICRLFGIPVPEVELTPEEQREMDCYRAYRDAAHYLGAQQTDELSPIYRKRQDQYYHWKPETLRDLQIGSVPSFEAYWKHMTATCGYPESFLQDIDLDNRWIFKPDSLIFTVSNERGQPCGFAARQLQYDLLTARCKKWVEEQRPSEEELREAKRKLPHKFMNTDKKCPIYKKGSLLFGFHLARRVLTASTPLWVFEGYADMTTAYDAGLPNVCAIGATAFTPQHIELLLNSGVKHIIFALDGDKAGERGTEKFVRIVEEHCAKRVGLTIEIVVIPGAYDDPDKMIRKHGLDAFLALPKVDLFAWRMQRFLEEGEDPKELAKRMVGVIANEESQIERAQRCRDLAKLTGIPEQAIRAELKATLDGKTLHLKEQATIIAGTLTKSIRLHPENVVHLVRDAQEQLDRLALQQHGDRKLRMQKYIHEQNHRALETKDPFGFTTGYHYFDTLFGGIPKSRCLMTTPGKPNAGKSTFGINCVWRLLMRHKELRIFVHTIDDSMDMFLWRLYGSMFRVPATMFGAAGYYLAKDKKIPRELAERTVYINTGDEEDTSHEPWDFAQVREMAIARIDEWIAEDRLILQDVNLLDDTPEAFEWMMDEIREEDPTSPLFVLMDNFHKYQLPGISQDSVEQRNWSKRVKKATTKFDATILATVELPKESLALGQRPRLANIKGSAGIPYDTQANIGIYNDHADYLTEAQLVWEQQLAQAEEVSPGRRSYLRKNPVLEMVFDKVKVGPGFKGEIYYPLEPKSGQLLEASPDQQEAYARLSRESQEAAKDKGKKKGKGQGFSTPDGPPDLGNWQPSTDENAYF